MYSGNLILKTYTHCLEEQNKEDEEDEDVSELIEWIDEEYDEIPASRTESLKS